MKYQQGDWSTRRFSQQRTSAGVRLDIAAFEGRYRPKPRTLEFWVRDDAAPARVQIEAARTGEVPRVDPASWERTETGWMMDGAYVKVKLPDPRDTAAVVLVR